MVIITLAVLLTFNVFINIAPILAGAGILGLAISFGAQSLVRDIISGFFILLENQFAVGDVIEAAGKSGVVERMTLRVVVLRDLEGTMHVIPNGELKVVSNKTRGWARAVVDISVPYTEDVDRALGVVRDEAAQFSTDPVWGLQLDGPVEVLGVESMTDNSVVIRTLLKTQPGSQWDVAREFRRRLINRFSKEAIESPFQQRRVHVTVKGARRARRWRPRRPPELPADGAPALQHAEPEVGAVRAAPARTGIALHLRSHRISTTLTSGTSEPFCSRICSAGGWRPAATRSFTS